jgi:uncharacterized membrane protein
MSFRFARMLKPGAVLLCLSIGLAVVPARGETVDVTGVAADDVLNLRAEPRAGAALVGALAPAASGVEALRQSGGWTYVRSGQMEGWASARYLRPALSFSGGPPPFPLHCVGTEPFWSLTLDGKRAIYRTPEIAEAASPVASLEPSRNSTIVWRVRPADGPIMSAVIEARQACSDNMSDTVYSFRIHAETRDGQLLSGCCEVKR